MIYLHVVTATPIVIGKTDRKTILIFIGLKYDLLAFIFIDSKGLEETVLAASLLIMNYTQP